MPLAIFGISNTAANLVVTGLILLLFAIWIALVIFTWNDARRRIEDPFLIGCSTLASFIFPFFGTIIYTILRPGEYLDDARERELEVKDTEARLRLHDANSCRKCGFPTQPDYIKCPSCRTRLKQPCPSCSRPVGLNWKLCPYCEKTLIAPKRSSRRDSSETDEKGRPRRRKASGSKATSGSKAATGSEATSGSKAATGSEATAGSKAAAGSEATAGSKTASGPKPESGQRTSRRRSTAPPESGASTDGARTERAETPDPARRSSRSSRRKVVVADDESGSKPINRGDAGPKGEDAEPR